MNKLIRMAHTASREVAKHSPVILTVAGVVGLGATAYTSYKAARKVEVIVEDVEERREAEETINELESITADRRTAEENNTLRELNLQFKPVDRFEVAKELTGALALPIALGVGSVLCIGLSYHIQNNRIVNLAAALATAQAEKVYYSNKFKNQYGEEEHKKFYTPTHEKTIQVEDDKGKTHDVDVDMKDDMHELHGFWWDKSEEYVADDHDYNMQMIASKEDQLDFRLFRKGFLLMNEVRDALGIPRTRLGGLVGWTTGTGFNIDTTVTNCYDEKSGQLKPEIYVRWNDPKYIYNDVEFDQDGGYATK